MGPRRAAASVFAMVVALAASARADQPAKSGRFTGSETCGGCHEAELDSWRATAHARAGAGLGQKARLRRCQTCHTTGDAPAGRPAFSGVGCEACHGAGAGYATEDIMRDPTLARLLGATDLSTPEARAAVCAGCHRSATRLAPFDAEQAWQKVKHG